MKKLFLFLAVILLAAVTVKAQVTLPAPNATTQTLNITKGTVTPETTTPSTTTTIKRNCGTMEHLEWMKQQDPTLEARMQAEEQKFNDYIAAHQQELENNKTAYTLPVVVHLVYKSSTGADPGDITPAMVAEQIAQTNKDWAGTNGRSMQAFNSSLRADAGITLCLATKDPSGNATTGVTYTTTTVTSFSTNDAVKSSSSGGKTGWTPSKYLNIWVCDMQAFNGGYCGYAQFPSSGINATYGVVIDYKCFGIGSAYGGTSTTATAPFNAGGTVSHEFGHCFNLAHIWGDDGGGCTQTAVFNGSDGCTDTPNQADACQNNGTWTGVHTDACTTTSPGIMYMNFMDYSDDKVYANVTPNQVTRMQGAVSSYLTAVAANSATACGTSVLTAAFSGTPTSGNNPLTVNFTDASAGPNTITSRSWTFGDGGTSTATNPSHTYTANGTYTVSLTVGDGTSTDTETKTGYITVSDAPVVDQCTWVPYPVYGAACDTGYYAYRYQSNGGYVTGNNAYTDTEIAQKFTNTISGVVDSVSVACKAVKNPTAANITVKIYAVDPTTKAPGTLLGTSNAVAFTSISTSGAWQDFIFSTPATVTGDFFASVVLPQGTGDTMAVFSTALTCSTADSMSWEYDGTTWYAYKTSFSSYNYNFDLAMIANVCTVTTDINPALNDNNVQIYPNPTQDQFTVDFLGTKHADASVQVFDATGRLIKNISSNGLTDKFIVDVSNEDTGIYFVHVVTQNGTIVKKISILK